VGKTIQLFGIALVLLLGGLAGLRSVTTASDAYYDAAHDYANTGSLVYLHDVPKSLEDQVLTELVTEVARNNGFVIRGDALFDQISGAVSGIRFGVAGDAKKVTPLTARIALWGSLMHSSRACSPTLLKH
jgi:hypothetical protein